MNEKKQKPICPCCEKEMTWTLYRGYYDSFEYWACECTDGEQTPEAVWEGAYV